MRALLFLFLLAGAHLPAFAQESGEAGRRPPSASRWAPESGVERQVPLGMVVREIRMQFGGQMLDAQEFGGRYLISWMSGDGRRLEIQVDAASGRIMSVRG